MRMQGKITENLKYISLFSLTPIFLLYVFFPSIFMAKIDMSSYATGILLYSLILIGFGYFFAAQKITHIFYLIQTIVLVLALFILFVLIHSAAIFFTIGSFNFVRALGSISILLLMFVAAYLLVLIAQKTTTSSFIISLSIICGTLYLMALLSIIGFNPMSYSNLFNTPIFPFTEPAHFALITSPFYFWAICIQKLRVNKFLAMFCLIIITLFINNLTIIFLILIGLYLSLKLRNFLILFCVLIFFSSFFLTFDLTYYTDRLDLQGDNLSTLVWVQGWEEAFINFKSTYGLGVGFQQLGVKDPLGNASNSIYIIFGDYLNRYDGGTMGAKLISEFGVLGMIFIVLLLKRVIISFKTLVNLKSKPNITPQYIFYNCCVVSVIVELFIRTVGYMGPSFFMILTGLIGLKIEERMGVLKLDNIYDKQ